MCSPTSPPVRKKKLIKRKYLVLSSLKRIAASDVSHKTAGLIASHGIFSCRLTAFAGGILKAFFEELQKQTLLTTWSCADTVGLSANPSKRC